MDVKAWMREQLHSGAFAAIDDVKPAELAKAARVALRLPRDQAQQCRLWAIEVLAEPRPERSASPPAQPCRVCRAQPGTPHNDRTHEAHRRISAALLDCLTWIEAHPLPEPQQQPATEPAQ